MILTSRTNLVGEYRFQATDYDTAPHRFHDSLSPRRYRSSFDGALMVHVRGGETFRSLETDGDTANPDFEGSLNYTSSNHSLGWTTSYGVESPTATGASTSKTSRTGLKLTYDLTSRISSTTAVYYHHDENQGSFIRNRLDRDAGFFRSFCSACVIRSTSVSPCTLTTATPR